jgi:hypothetical protein
MGTQSKQQVKQEIGVIPKEVGKARRRKSSLHSSQKIRAPEQQNASKAKSEAFGKRAIYTLQMLRQIRSDTENGLLSPSPTVKDPFVRFAESSWSIIDRLELAIEELERGDPRGFEHANEIISLIRP